jgi:hypothetical protein
MMKKRLAILAVLLLGFAVIFASCAGMQKPTAANFKDPVITLESFMVPQYTGFWFYSAKEKPVKGDAGNHGAPLPLSFLFNVQNPNPYPVLLDGFRFTVNFDGFDLITVNVDDSYWIPAGMTDQVRATTMITVETAQLSLLVAGGFQLTEKKMSAWDALEKWWRGVPDASVPVVVHEGAASFSADGVSKVIPFQAKFP